MHSGKGWGVYIMSTVKLRSMYIHYTSVSMFFHCKRMKFTLWLHGQRALQLNQQTACPSMPCVHVFILHVCGMLCLYASRPLNGLIISEHVS
jgi:hypothetical protein